LHPKENVTTHSTDTPQGERHNLEEVREVLHSGLHEIYERGVPDYAVIHFYFHCERMHQDFVFTGAGKDRKTLKQLRCGKDLDLIIDRFAQMIQSGRNVTFDDNTRVVYYAFIPPTFYR